MTQGFTGEFSLGSGTLDAAALDAAGNMTVNGFTNGFPWWADDPQVELYRTSMEATVPDVDLRNPAATVTWSALELFRTALDATPPAAETVSADDVLAAYYALDGETLDGLLPGPVTFTEGSGAQPSMPCSFLLRYEDASSPA